MPLSILNLTIRTLSNRRSIVCMNMMDRVSIFETRNGSACMIPDGSDSGHTVKLHSVSFTRDVPGERYEFFELSA